LATVFIAAHVEPDLAAAVKARSERDDRSVSSVIRLALREFLSSTSEAAGQGGSAKTREAVEV
jgi:hypothetical protein